MIDIGAIDIALIRHITKFTHSLHLFLHWNISPRGRFLQVIQMSQVSSINRVFFHKLHHPPYCFGNFADWGRQFYGDDRDIGSQSQNEERPSPLSLQSDFRRILAQPSSLRHQQRSDTMLPFRDYEISFLFLLLVKFYGSGKSEMYSPVQRILQCFLPSAT